MKEDMDTAIEISTVKANHKALDRRVIELEKKMSSNLEKIYEKLEKLGNRPSWLTASIIAFLSSGFFTMLTIVLMRSPK